MRLLLRLCLPVALLASTVAPARAEKLERPRPTITTSREGNDLRVVVHGVTDYCSSDADTHITRASDIIRILHDRPQRVSRCISTQELTFVIKDVGPGRYTISYERMPLVAPARPLTVATTTVSVY